MELIQIILGFVGLLILITIITYNTLVRLRNDVEKTYSSIDVQIKRKVDLIPNLVKMVKGYMKHEEGLLTALTEARTSIMNASANQDVTALAKGENMLQESLKSIFAVSENYPDLKASQNFLELQEALEETEDQIAAARRIYNESVNVYNTKTEVFPSVIFASMFKFTRKKLFEMDSNDAKSVSIDF
jgi:LemA protein